MKDPCLICNCDSSVDVQKPVCVTIVDLVYNVIFLNPLGTNVAETFFLFRVTLLLKKKKS